MTTVQSIQDTRSPLRQELDGYLDLLQADVMRNPLFVAVLGSEQVDVADYVRLIALHYHQIKATDEMVTTAGRTLQASDREFHRTVGRWLTEHAEEETGHEKFITRDLKRLGRDPGADVPAEPGRAIAAYIANSLFVAAQPDLAIGIVANAYLLQGWSERVGPIAGGALRQRSNIENIDNAMYFVETHGILDVDHMQEMREQVDEWSPQLDEADWRALRYQAVNVATQYPRLGVE
jgi:hypothetical protein